MHWYSAYNCALPKWRENEFFHLLGKLEFVSLIQPYTRLLYRQ